MMIPTTKYKLQTLTNQYSQLIDLVKELGAYAKSETQKLEEAIKALDDAPVPQDNRILKLNGVDPNE